jgi:hypothetical protein
MFFTVLVFFIIIKAIVYNSSAVGRVFMRLNVLISDTDVKSYLSSIAPSNQFVCGGMAEWLTRLTRNL